MKKFILALWLSGWTMIGFGQTPVFIESFKNLSKGGKPQGWIVSSNTGADSYERPFECTADTGLTTPSVGKDAPSRFILPAMTFDATSNIVMIRFKVFVLDANLKCSSVKDFPCPTYARIMLIKDSYSGGINSLPATSDIYDEQTYRIAIANGDNTVIFNNPPLSNGTSYRLYFDFKTAVNSTCTSTGTKFIFDDFRVFKTICPGDCPPVANDDYFNASEQHFLNTVKGNVYGGFALWSSAAPAGYEMKSLSISPASNDGLDYDNNNHDLSSMQFILVSGPTVVDQYGCSSSENLSGTFVWNGNGTFEYTRAKSCVERVTFTYKIKDPTNLYSNVATVTMDFPPNIILPVTFTSFIVVRNGNTARLNWETASETNCSGFYVQRNTDGDWINRAFVFTASEKGTSTTPLKYHFSDSNYNKTATQYRLVQVDQDGKYAYSSIQTVPGMEDGLKYSLLAYPNPAKTTVNLIISGNLVNTEAFLQDISGRQLHFWNRIPTNPMVIDGLLPGAYIFRVRNTQTGEIGFVKLIITGK